MDLRKSYLSCSAEILTFFGASLRRLAAARILYEQSYLFASNRVQGLDFISLRNFPCH
jgi:hypothetical protein